MRSDQTTVVDMTASELAAIQELPSVRYMFSFVLEEIGLEQLKQDFEGHEVPRDLLDHGLKIWKVLTSLYAKLKQLDQDAVLLTWHSDEVKGPNYFDSMDANSFPKDIVEMRSYFEGINLRKKSGRVYLRFRFHANPQEETYLKLKHWSDTSGYRLTKCIVQAESSVSIGWILYSSDYTEIDFITKQLKEAVGVEVGLKMTAITTTDEWQDDKKQKRTEWRDRIKALVVHVATEHAQMASSHIAVLFEPRTIFTGKWYPKWSERYLFTPPEYAIPNDEKLHYKRLINRQAQHLKQLRAYPCHSIMSDIDYQLLTTKGVRISLRSMVLRIQVREGSDTTGLHLFQSIDFCPDLSQVWINKSKSTNK